MSIVSVRTTRETRAAMDRGLILRTILPNGRLSGNALAARLNLPPRRVRRALADLHDWGMLRSVLHGTAWEITARGRSYAATAAGRALMDVPLAVAG
ncbi:winged helix-turn-helix domain-containing protein [Nocardia puris]|uniref:winged helix-turn-helix domain-containing protein n=1 Tax=Nocardia puris TaxID=208602 RepID=UPI0018953ECF|nr:winged helix-turn-helix domain-containing protein [Nocardia puris]MBF6460763.1 winged helix-turn-helix domain-containing protein [Nocardia puris]